MLLVVVVTLLFVCSVISASASTQTQAQSIKSTQNYTVGAFAVSWSCDAECTIVVANADKVVWESTNLPFIWVESVPDQAQEQSGNFYFADGFYDTYNNNNKINCSNQTVTSFSQPSASSVEFSGLLCSEIGYTLSFSANPLSVNQLLFNLSLQNDQSDYQLTKLVLAYKSKADELFFGFGTQYTVANMKGQRLPVFSQEQGVGRGDEPLTTILNQLFGFSGGAWYTTYTHVPFYYTNYKNSLYLLSTERVIFDMTQDDSVQVELIPCNLFNISAPNYSFQLAGSIIAAYSFFDIITEYTAYAGRMKPLPLWVGNGALLGLEGGSEVVMSTVKSVLNATTPALSIAGVWLQDWTGVRHFQTRDGLWWNWELDEAYYNNWSSFVDTLSANNIRVLNYVNPMLANISASPNAPNYTYNLFNEAVAEQYFVMQPSPSKSDDNSNVIWIGYEGAGLIDLTNPSARKWYKQIIQNQVLSVGGRNVSGFMLDFGEALPLDGILFSGEDARKVHNRYPSMWCELANEAVEELGLSDEIVFWARSGYSTSPRWCSSFWLGDQLLAWDNNDGLASAVTGLITSGLSGFSLQHSDIGGYTNVQMPSAVENAVVNYTRSKELFMRWAEFGVFSAIFRTHPGSKPSVNWQFNSDAETLEHFAAMTDLFVQLQTYRQSLMQQAYEIGLPLARHMMLHYPDDANVYNITTQFLFGNDLLVAPITQPQVSQIRVYFPSSDDKWKNLWTESVYTAGWNTIQAEIGSPAVFIRVPATGDINPDLQRIQLVR